MSEEIIENNETPKDEKPSFDPDAFKKDVLEQVAATNRQMLETVLASRSAPQEPQIVSPASDDTDIEEFKSEMEAIGVDENQTKGLIKLMSKFMSKQAPSFKKEVLSEVNTTMDIKDKKQAYTQSTRMMYPDVDNQSSALFQMAKQVYREMSEEARSGPDAEAIAVERAAARLNIRPITIDDIKARDAVTKSGEGGISDKKAKELDKSFASFFNVDYAKANKKFTTINQNQKH